MSVPTRCFRCKGKGKVRKDVANRGGEAFISLGVSALIDKAQKVRCPACFGRGFIR